MRCANQSLPRPGELVGGRLVPGEHQGEEIVAQLAVTEGLAILGISVPATARECPRRSPRSSERRRLAMIEYTQ